MDWREGGVGGGEGDFPLNCWIGNLENFQFQKYSYNNTSIWNLASSGSVTGQEKACNPISLQFKLSQVLF